MPYMHNISIDDPEMGFIKLHTIFDYLAPNTDVEWVYYEQNVSMLRMYDRYRLDNERVLPLGATGDGLIERITAKPTDFAVRARNGTLPPVVFIEPRIAQIPPLEQANDDHPPANIIRGQEFLQTLVQILKSSPQWEKTTLVITYDEHGGFYDHMAPPGTPASDRRWLVSDGLGGTTGGFAKLHPDGPTHLGVRVPTFIVSPLVQPGSVSHAVFDHTSLIKTILVRHRKQFQRNIFELFGKRVAQINHLGEALRGPLPPRVLARTAPLPIPRTAANYGDTPTPRYTLAHLSNDVRAGDDDVP